MNKIVERLKEEFQKTPDFKIKEVKVGLMKTAYVAFIDTICSSDKINDYILKNLTHYNSKNDFNSNLAGPNNVIIDNEDQIEYYITSGFAIVICDKEIIAIEVKGDLSRSISASTREPSLLGPEDSFNENIQTNIGLIKRRIKTHTLKSEEIVLGRKTKTVITINYLEDVAKEDNINLIKEKLSDIDIDGVLDLGNIINYLESENRTVFPTIKRTERPDFVVTALLEGKIALLMDTSPFAIILPTFLVDFINPVSDNYVKSINVTFLKILRAFCFIKHLEFLFHPL